MTTREMREGGTGSGTLLDPIVTLQAWDDSSRLTSQTDGNSHTTAYFYDELDRPSLTRCADRRPRQVLHYRTWDVWLIDYRRLTWNPTQDKVARTELLAQGPGLAQAWEYDSVNRMVRSVRTPAGGQTATID